MRGLDAHCNAVAVELYPALQGGLSREEYDRAMNHVKGDASKGDKVDLSPLRFEESGALPIGYSTRRSTASERFFGER
jgi:hypothetical protein